MPPPLPNVMCSWRDASLRDGSARDAIEGLLRFGMSPADVGKDVLGPDTGMLLCAGVEKPPMLLSPSVLTTLCVASPSR